MRLDFHVHTVKAGPHSNLHLSELVERIKLVGIEGVCITEHDRVWPRFDLDAFRAESGLSIMEGMEVGTDLGHIGAFGLTQFVGGIHKAHELRKVLDEVGGVMIALHPFRRHFDQGHNKYPVDITPEQAAELPLFQLCDAIEVLNGANTEPENELAYRVARVLNKPGTGGSDAHSMHGLGNYSTQFERPVANVRELIDEIKAGRVWPSLRIAEGQFARYPEDIWDADVL